ncbi:uncharacterized protein LOC115065687 [Mus pahari]|uniref:uncharacterized protein LOC115065687 n=1 Tax=Mus pahari TaxID=10093 RepID=UPI001114B74A|nr:uncharacterized protein LOC115065687 [Mus pahari]
MARPPAISMHRARGASVPSRRCIRSPGSARRVARSVPVPSGRPRWLSRWPRLRPGPLGPEPARRPGSERPGPLRPPGRSGMHVNLEKVTEHAGRVLRGRAWAHAGPHALVGVRDKGLQWRQPWTRDSILRVTLAWWVVGCKTTEARRAVGPGFGVSPCAGQRPFHPAKSCGSCSALPWAVPARPGAQRKSPRTSASGRGHASAALAAAKTWSGRAVDVCAAGMIKVGENLDASKDLSPPPQESKHLPCVSEDPLQPHTQAPASS